MNRNFMFLKLRLLLETSNKDSLFIAAEGLINLRHQMCNWKFVIIWKGLSLRSTGIHQQ